MKNLIPTIIIALAIISCSCESTEPIDPRQLSIKVEDVSCTEAWISLRTHYLDLPANISIAANSNLIAQFTLNKSDTIIYVDSLKPGTEYSLQAATSEVNSEKVTAATMGTTSHKTNWEVFEFGDHGNSVLFDVAVIDENNIWAVGEIYLNDSLGQPDPKAYNAVHWDGSKWTLKRIPFAGCGAVLYPTIYSVLAFSENDIWFTRGGTVLNFNGSSYRNYCEMNPLLTGSLNKLWGTSSNNLYGVGDDGNIVHYNGSSWQKIHSGTDVNLNSICGVNGGKKLWISGYALNSLKGAIIELENNVATTIWARGASGSSTPPYGDRIEGLWCVENNLYVLSNDGLFRKKIKLDLPVQKIQNDFPFPQYKLTGSADNDIYAVGSRSTIWHFNGNDWVLVNQNLTDTSILYSASTNNGITAAVGTKVENVVYHRGVIIINALIL